MSKISTARRHAYDLLCRMGTDSTYSNIAADAVIRNAEMSDNDRALFSILVFGVIERRITLDYYINSLSTLPPEKIDGATRNALRLGFYQILYLERIPHHAAVNETVALCRAQSRGFANALLRELIRRGASLPLPDKSKKPYRYLSIKYSFPIPLCRRFCEIFGADRAERILAAFSDGGERRVTLRVNTLKCSRTELKAALEKDGVGTVPGRISPDALKVTDGIPDLAADERFFVQDEASQLCVKVLGATPGQRVIDMCAAPGSKSFGIAIDMNNEGYVRSCDLHASKLSLIRDGAARLGIDIISAEVRDGTVEDEELFESFDRVLCDVPCSGYGVLAKKPEIRFKPLEDVKDLPDIQLSIAKNAAKYLKRGGIMVYSTCTLLPEENEENVARLLRECPGLELVPFTVGDVASETGMLTLTPEVHGTDGFFIARLKRL